ncbi:MAG: cytochrome c, partial [Alphaproteobacteria bacterium]|nr:cytochrome c [Alphaproteobacteria bacterium]
MKRRSWLTVVFLAGALSALAGAGMTAAGAKLEGVVEPQMTPELNLGKMNYRRYCAECHGVNGVGTDKGPTFLHRVYHPGHHADFSFIRAVRQGARAHHWRFGDMKPVEGVTDRQLEKIVKYVRALQK